MDISQSKCIHFIGIGGCGMSAIARVLLQLGYRVSGSDMKESLYTIRLRDEGAKVFVKHDAAQLREADIVVASTAVQSTNVEYAHAVEEHIPIVKRAEMLHHVMEHFHTKIAVTGTHGKTTGSAMVTRMLSTAGLQPTFIVGSDLQDYGVNANVDGRHYVVVESDESDGSFLMIAPTIGVVLNLEEEHMEYYQTRENLLRHFDQFMTGIIDRRGTVIINQDDDTLRELAASYPPEQVLRFGLDSEADLTATHLEHQPQGIAFTLCYQGKDIDRCQLRTFGRHNVYNALATACVGMKEGLSWEAICTGLGSFSGTKRRLQHIGSQKEIDVYDDYAHHPTEIRTTLQGVKAGFNKRVICVFQPHRYSRTRDLMEEFSESFQEADHVIITDIYAAGESPIEGISSNALVERMTKKGYKAQHVAKKSDVPSTLIPTLQPGDIVLTMGAGDITLLGKELLARLEQQPETHA